MADILESRHDLDEVLFKALTAVYNFEADKKMRFELSYQEIFLLQVLRRHSPSRMTDVASWLKIPISTATRVVGRLETMKLLSREKDSADRRVISVSLTEEGEHAVRAVENHTYSLITKNLKGGYSGRTGLISYHRLQT